MSAYGKHEEMKKVRDDEHYTARKKAVDSKWEKPKQLLEPGGTLNPASSFSRPQATQTLEKNGMPSNSLNAGPVEQNGISVYKRGFIPRSTQNKETQRKSNMTHIEHWVKVQKGDTKRLVS